MIGRCTDCMVVVNGLPNVPACRTPVSAGLAVRNPRMASTRAASRGEAGARHDASIVVVGAGPAGLAAATGRRLPEPP